MAELSPAEELPSSSTPLDLLLNAISGSADYRYPNGDVVDDEGEGGQEDDAQLSLGGLLEASRASTTRARKADYTQEDLPSRRAKIAETLTSHLVASASRGGIGTDRLSIPWNSDTPSLFSTVEVWHPRTGQKSYKQERRILNPPPMLRVKGPLFSLLTSATLSSVHHPSFATTARTMSSQTHPIPLGEPVLETVPIRLGRPRKAERDETKRKMRDAAAKSGFGASLPYERKRALARERDALKEGLAFSGLWVAEEVGKGKEFKLQLSLGQPGAEHAETTRPHVHSSEAVDVDPDLGDFNGTPLEGWPNIPGGYTQRDSESAFPNHLDDTMDQEPRNTSAEQLGEAFAPANSAAARLPWATLTSEPLSIVSKPSQKTAKARSMASCLTERDAVALWVRINAQTVRTKYMKLEAADIPQITAKTGKWTPFHFEIVHRASPPLSEAKPSRSRFKPAVEDEDANVLTYGSTVILVDDQSGVRSEAVKLVKVEKNEVVLTEDEGHPVSELQRVGFVRLEGGLDYTNGGGRWYLSAPGARLGGGELFDPAAPGPSRRRKAAICQKLDTESSITKPETLESLDNTGNQTKDDPRTPERPTKKRKTPRNALALATLTEEEENSSQAILSWAQAERAVREVGKKEDANSLKGIIAIEKVEDWMCWVIGGVSSFSYNFFDGLAGLNSMTQSSINPIPQLLADPTFYAESNTLNLVVSNFHSPEPLDVYLGSIGPLAIATQESPSVPEHPVTPLNEAARTGGRSLSTRPFAQEPVIVTVEMPNPEGIIRTMQDCATSSAKDQVLSYDNTQTQVENPWLRETDRQHSDLTIREALLNVENASHADLPLANALPEQGGEVVIDPSLDPGDQARSFGESDPVDLDRKPDEEPKDAQKTADLIPPPLALIKPQRQEWNNEMVPLPLLLVRPSDGVGYGTGWSVVAERLAQSDEAMTGLPRWGLRVVAS